MATVRRRRSISSCHFENRPSSTIGPRTVSFRGLIWKLWKVLRSKDQISLHKNWFIDACKLPTMTNPFVHQCDEKHQLYSAILEFHKLQINPRRIELIARRKISLAKSVTNRWITVVFFAARLRNTACTIALSIIVNDWYLRLDRAWLFSHDQFLDIYTPIVSPLIITAEQAIAEVVF